jgi:hypothetical protein
MDGGGSSKIDARELLKDRQFLSSLVKIISQQTNVMANGGTYSGGLGADSF